MNIKKTYFIHLLFKLRKNYYTTFISNIKLKLRNYYDKKTLMIILYH